MDGLRTFGVAGVGGSVVIALVPAVVAAQAPALMAPPDPIPRWLVLGLIMLVPAVVGAIGVRWRNRAVLVASAGACLPVSILSIATLPIVIPALLFLAAARAAGPTAPRRSWLAAVAIVVLVGSSLFGLITSTETRCWLAFEGPSGMEFRIVTEADAGQPLGGPGGPVAAGCDGGQFAARSVGLAAVLGAGAVAVAFAATRRRPPAT